MKFTKIKYDGKKVELSWNEKGKKGTEISHTLTSSEKPDAELPQALKAFCHFVERLLEVHSNWMATLKVTGLSINQEEDGRSGLVITSQKKLADANAPLVVNTPHLRQAVKLGEDGPGFFLLGMEDAIDRAEDAASGFVAGKRAQRGLFDSEPAGDKARELAGATSEEVAHVHG